MNSDHKIHIPFYKGILFRVCIVILVAMLSSVAIGTVYTYNSAKKEEEADAIDAAKDIADGLRSGFSDEGLKWIFDYWESNYSKMDVFIVRDTSITEDEEEWLEEHDMARRLWADKFDEGLSLDDLEKLDDNGKRLFAEYIYYINWTMFNSFASIEGKNTIYRIYKVIETDEGKKAFVIMGNRIQEDNEVPLGHVDDFNSERHPIVTRILESDIEPDETEHFESNDGKYYLYASWPIRLGGGATYIASVMYPWTETRNDLIDQTRQFIARVAVYIIITELLILLLFNIMILKPVRKLQEQIRDYTKDKDSGDCEQALFDINKRNDEVGSLSRDVTDLTKEMDRYVKEIYDLAEEKADAEATLSVATKIQADMLPCAFPAFPDRNDFDIFASMTPAKEVGGDFYDFFLLDDDHLAMVMADVSEKGIPAALFMVISKTLIKDQAQMCRSPKTILEEVNNKLYECNGEGMFVTVWLGILTLSTGKIVAANAGHEYPAIRKADGKFELVMDKHGFVLGTMKDMKYTEYEMELEKGGCLFLYTDGVPEATNADEQLFGTDRMIEALNKEPGAAPSVILANVKKATDEFVGEAPQFDDLTMLAVTLK